MPADPRRPPIGFSASRRVAIAVLIALLYLAGAMASRLLIVQPQGIAPIWPPSGMVLAALLLTARESWLATLAAVFVANLAANLLTGGALAASLGFALANCAEAGLAAALVERRVGLPLSLSRLREVVGLALWAAIIGNAATALLGAAVARLALGAPFAGAWLTWWVGDGLAMVLVTPAILAWASGGGWHEVLTGRQRLEFIALYAGAAIAALLTFGAPPTALSYPYQVLPFLLWAAVRFGPRQTVTLALLLAGIILWNTIAGRGPFALQDHPLAWQVLAAQGFLSVVMLSALVLAAITQERKQARDALERGLSDLERRVGERTAELQATNQQLEREIGERQRAETFLGAVLQQLPLGVSIAEAPSGRLLLHNADAERLLGHPLRESADYQGYAQYGALHGDDRPYAPGEYPIARALLGHEEVRDEEMIYRRGDGTIALFSVSAAPIHDADGQMIAVVSTFHDISALKRVEATLARSQAQLASIIGSAMDAIIAVDGGQRITIWNAAAERMFLCPAGEALGQPLDRFIPARYREQHRAHIQHFGQTGTTTRSMGGLLPLAALRANGEEFPIEASISQVAVDGEKLYTVILRDITARVRAEHDLRSTEERFSKAFMLGPTAMVISTLSDGRILDINDRFLKLFGQERATVLGHSSVMLDMWNEPADRAEAVRRLREQGSVRDYEVSIRAAGGLSRAVLLSAELLQLAGEPCILTTLYDISERKQAEQALLESRQQLQAILDNAPALISLKNSDGYYLLVNRGFVAALGRGPDTIVGRTDHDLFPHELAAQLRASDRAVLEQGTPLELEEILPHADGTHTYSSIKFPLIDLSGASYALGNIATDVTERKLLEAQLFQAQKMESIGQLAGGIAHDFNNLLTAITGYADLALTDMPPAAGPSNDVREIQKAAMRAAALTRQLLAFARRQPLDPQVVNANQLLADLDKLLRRLINEDIDLGFRLAPDLGNVKVDPGQIEQVVINLVVNARDAMPNGGQLIVETANVVLDPRYTHGRLDLPAGRYVSITVSDTGIGMTPEVQMHVFEPFFTTKELGRGTGLGLSTCYGIVKQHGGTIWIYSEPGQGTAVKVYLPEVSEAAGENQAAARDTQAPRGTETILVAEDEDAVRNLVARVLRAQGYSVIAAATGVEAVRAARQHAPAVIDLLLTDMVMPQMSGNDAAQQIRAIYPNIKVLFMSGYTEHATLRHNRMAHGSPFLQKPFTPSALLQAVRALLERGSEA